jgi:hypothetical protein
MRHSGDLLLNPKTIAIFQGIKFSTRFLQRFLLAEFILSEVEGLARNDKLLPSVIPKELVFGD